MCVANETSQLKNLCKKIGACRQGEDWRTALWLLASLRGLSLRANAILQNAAINACGKCLHWQRAAWLLSDAQCQALQCDVISYNTIVPLVVWPLALALLHVANPVKLDVVTFNSFHGSSWQRAAQMCQEMCQRSLQADLLSYNSAIRDLTSRWSMALGLVARSAEETLQADVVTCTSCLSMCHLWWERSFAMLHSWSSRHLSGNSKTYNALISRVTSSNWLQALVVFSDLFSGRLVRADVISHNAVITGSTWSVALSLFQRMRRDGTRPSAISENTVISTCERQQLWHQSLAFGLPLGGPWWQALSRLKLRNLQAGVVVVGAAVNACVTSGWRRAQELLDLLRQRFSEPNVIIHNSMVSACEKSHAWQNALQMDDIDLPGFNAAISACEKAEEWQQSLRLLWSLPISADVVSCNAALSACEKRQKWQIALQLLQSFPVPRSSTSCNAAIAACQTCWPVAMELLTSFSFWRLQRDEVSFSSAIAVCENWQLALSLLVEMLQKALQPNLLSYNSVMFSCLRHGLSV
ncbi:Pentatricopeptide repeat-containing protein At2g31400 [Durusdinium trenchii]|uniref:Chloroplastic n=1 Tax=Durusdinium trenchii TaxID=1381693 RepID=A0ABP0L2E9_9DINO